MLRHVSDAFVEDPVRLLRLARLAARLVDFTVAPETMALLRRMVADGEVDALVPERVWQELARGLMSARPSRMFTLLRDCGALARLLPEVDRLWGVPQPPEHHPEIDTGLHLMLVLDQCARLARAAAGALGLPVHDLGKGTTPPDQWPRHLGHEGRSAALARRLAERLRVPTDCRELADVVAREHGNVHRSGSLDAGGRAAAVRALRRAAPAGAFCRGAAGLRVRRARPHRARGRRPTRRRRACRRCCRPRWRSIPPASRPRLPRSGRTGPAIGAAIHEARRAAVHAALQTDPLL